MAEYSGDTIYPSKIRLRDITTQASSTTLAISPSATSVSPGQTISVTVTMTIGSPPAPGITPSGVVTLNLDGSSVGTGLGPLGRYLHGNLSHRDIPTARSTSHTLLATYAASTDFAASTSRTSPITVSKITTTLAISTASLTPPGNSASDGHRDHQSDDLYHRRPHRHD